jgi:hypothetical protein
MTTRKTMKTTMLAALTALATLSLTSGAWAAGTGGGDTHSGIIAVLIGLLRQMGYTLSNTMISGLGSPR